ncbi:MAG: IS66 family transposase, partial [bacterium]|nr:IS66 family transposase [bacterium]
MTKAKLKAEYESQKQQNATLKNELAYKDLIIANLQKMLFGSKSERFVPEVPSNQISLFEQEKKKESPQESPEKEVITYERNKPKKKQKPGGRIPLPSDLPRIEIVIEPEENTEGLVRIGEEVTEILDIIPPVFRVIHVIRPKYAKPEAKTEEVQNPIIIADMPSRVIDKGIPSTRLLAYIVMSKFIDHLPYYRQIKMFQRIGITIKSNTINGWIAKVCVLLKPLYDAFCKAHFSKSYLQADETTIKVLKIKKPRKKGKAHTGYYWVYYDPVDHHVVFIFDPGRGRVYPADHLKDFSGKLQTDGLKVYDTFDKLSNIDLYACMVHIRRKFVDALKNDKKRAEFVLTKIKLLYAIEEQA